jgi:pre-mRNA-splicing factor CWC22
MKSTLTCLAINHQTPTKILSSSPQIPVLPQAAMELASAVRLPTPEPAENLKPSSATKRKRSPDSASPPPRRHPSPPRHRQRSHSPGPAADRSSFRSKKQHESTGPQLWDVDRERAVERQRQLEFRQRKEKDEEPSKPVTAEEKQAAAKKEYEALLNKRSGGVYIPPARLRELQSQITDQKSKEFQRMAWEALKKSINGLINKVNISNIKYIVPELFGENLIRGRGLFCRSIMKAQAASLPFTPIFAATVAIVNTKLPQVGELLVKRLVLSFRKGFRRNDKSVCISTTTFLAHLVNQQVADYMLTAQILLLLLHKPTDDGVEIAVSLVKECGQILEEMNGKIALAVFDQFRNILHEASDLEKRTQYMIEVLFQIRKDKWKEYPAVREELDLVEEEDQITHHIDLEGDINVQDGLNIFKFDPEYEEHEDAYKKLRAEILGEADGSDEEYDSDASSEEEEEDEKERDMEIKDQTNTDLSNLRRSIYLTIKSSGTFEEACHKLMRINLPAGLEKELPSMVIQCSYQEQTFDKFYGNIGERFCKLNRLWQELFQELFVEYYETIHRYETNKLRIIAQFFGHLLSNDGIGWQVLSIIHLNEEETTSSSRIFIKILFEEISQSIGMSKLNVKLNEDILQPSVAGLFPKDNPVQTRFAINFFTAIGMGLITESMREHLKNLPQPAPPALPERARDDASDSASSYTSSSYFTDSRTPSRSRSRSPARRRDNRSRSHSRNETNDRGGGRGNDHRHNRRTRSYDSHSRSPSRTPSRSRTPPPRRHHDDQQRRSRQAQDGGRSHSNDRRDNSSSDSRSRSRSPPPRNRQQRKSASYNDDDDGNRRDNNRRSRSRSPPPVRRRDNDSPPRRRRQNTSSEEEEEERSRSPPPRRGGRDDRAESHSRSRTPPRRRR